MKGILFNTEMVQAILEDRKTQTRRLIDWDISNNMDGDVASGYSVQTDNGLMDSLELCKYQKGDILYVRETWKIVEFDYSVMGMAINYEADETWEYIEFSSDRFEKFKKYYDKKGWQPSIFMPKEAARIFLKVTDIRMERVQDITEENASNEGAKKVVWYKPYDKGPEDISGLPGYPDERISWRNGFATLWDGLYFEKGYGWDTNCWVWVIEFERCEKQDEN